MNGFPLHDFPAPWACAWGEDSLGANEEGRWQEFQVGKARQRMRWIAPGSFLMGSPENEEGRWRDETQHEVALTEGFWMADTACTQELWIAVMGNNPAHFQNDPLNPVEQVSWEDVQEFLSKLNAIHPGLDLILPSEAQWEYACRAGATGPFNFEGKPDMDRMIYSGNWETDVRALERRKTLHVKSFAPNAWGLYEMHGNVWEWCRDWYGAYPAGPAENPEGPDSGRYRVLRGGSWLHDGRHCRSAARNDWPSELRYSHLGFRLARGSYEAGASERVGMGSSTHASPSVQERAIGGNEADQRSQSNKKRNPYDVGQETIQNPDTEPEAKLMEKIIDKTRTLEFERSRVKPFHPYWKTQNFLGPKGSPGPVVVVDSFEGRVPYVMDDATRRSGGFRHSILVPAFLIDSNLASSLANIVNQADRGSDFTDLATLKWLDWAIQLGWDYNPTFYLMESLANGATRDYIISTAAAILRLHSMDEAIFQSSRRIVENPEARAYYLERTGAREYFELAEKQFVDFESGWPKIRATQNEMRQRIYACLLKMVLLRPLHKGKGYPIEMMAKFVQFLVETLGISMTREYALACYWFVSFQPAQDLLKVNENKDTADDARKKLLGCAMDLQYMRLPEILLWSAIEREMNLCVLATKDQGLAAMAELFTLQRLFGNEEEAFPFAEVTPIFDPLRSKKEFDQKVISSLDPRDPDFAFADMAKHPRKPISSSELNHLVDDLEIQLGYLLSTNEKKVR